MKFSIKFKLIAGFFIIIFMLLVSGSLNFLNMGALKNNSGKIYNDGVVLSQTIGHLDSTIKLIRGDIYKFIFFSTDRENIKTAITTEIQQVDGDIATYTSKINSIEEQEALNKFESSWSAYKTELNKIISNIEQNNVADAVGLISDQSLFNQAYLSLSDDEFELINLTVKGTNKLNEDNSTIFNNSAMISVSLAIVTLLVSIVILIMLIKNITDPITKVHKALQKMASGDLTQTVKIKSSDEVGIMAKSFNEMQKSVNKLITELKQNAEQLADTSDQLSQAAKQTGIATQQVANSSQQMAKGAQEQSASAQDTAKSVEELSQAIHQLAASAREQSGGVQKAMDAISSVSKTINEVTDNTDHAARGATNAAESAKAGTQKAFSTITGMDKIKSASSEVAKKIEELGTRSTEIGKIVAVIDDIASQTNLLALNAAIEAARAGEQGRGFAVVSDEVRKLAERTATATKEIADLISSIQKGVNEAIQVTASGSAAVDEGYTMALQARDSLETILSSISDVNAQVKQIAARTQNVNAAANELVKIIDDVGKITEQNTTAAEKMTSSAAEVSKIVETVAGIAEENSASTEEVSASAEEMSAQVEEIVASSQSLKETAENLKNSAGAFKIAEKKTQA
jgi:methyl-accepting chemotaxis protein